MQGVEVVYLWQKKSFYFIFYKPLAVWCCNLSISSPNDISHRNCLYMPGLWSKYFNALAISYCELFGLGIKYDLRQFFFVHDT